MGDGGYACTHLHILCVEQEIWKCREGGIQCKVISWNWISAHEASPFFL